VFLTHAGMVFSMGDGGKGQLGLGPNTKEANEPTMITGLLNYRVTDISVGANHNVSSGVLRDMNRSKDKEVNNDESNKDSFIFVWGDNNLNQLGLPSHTNEELLQEHIIDNIISVPTILEEFIDRKINKIETGLNHTLLLFDNNRLYGFGSNEYKQISKNDSSTIIKKPIRIKFNKNYKFTDIKCSSNSSLIITTTNKLIIMGKISSMNNYANIINLPENINLEELHIVLNDNKLFILYDSTSINNINISETEDLKTESLSIYRNSQSINFEDISPELFIRDTTNNNNITHGRNTNNNLDEEYEKEFINSDNESTNEIYDNNHNMSFEQSIEELRSYISLVGISLAG
jgi:alpha-tubulin suppressor-like RCC1 family protein